ncbi:hypothetical protein [Streptomyces sp. NPDC020141]
MAGALFFGCLLLFSAIGYDLNESTPSIPWAVSGLLVGGVAVAVLQKTRG